MRWYCFGSVRMEVRSLSAKVEVSSEGELARTDASPFGLRPVTLTCNVRDNLMQGLVEVC